MGVEAGNLLVDARCSVPLFLVTGAWGAALSRSIVVLPKSARREKQKNTFVPSMLVGRGYLADF